MPIDKKAALEQIDAVMEQLTIYYGKYRNGRVSDSSQWDQDVAEICARIRAAIDRLAPPASEYRKGSTDVDSLAGRLRCLRSDWDAGYLLTFQEMIHGATFSDFLAMAEHLLSDAYKDHAAVVAAATIAGGVVEQHLRALCLKHTVDPNYLDKKGNPQPKMINALNDDLYRTPPGAYSQVFMQQVKTWAVIRNHAAHGEYTEVDRQQVALMVAGIRLFIANHPA